MKLRVRNPTGKEVSYNATAMEIRNFISGWSVRPEFTVTTYEENDGLLIIIRRGESDEENKQNGKEI